MTIVFCPSCYCCMMLREGKYGKYYECVCGLLHGAHPDGSLLGIPADRRTRKLRVKAHKVFDSWWKSLGLKRKKAYRHLAIIMSVPQQKAHIAMFDEEQCRTLINLLTPKKVNVNDN
jgi:hypothetical protein